MTCEQHCEAPEMLFDRRFEKVHLWLDELFHTECPRHRRIRHNEAGIKRVGEIFVEEAGKAARQHIISDLKEYGWTEAERSRLNEKDYMKIMGL